MKKTIQYGRKLITLLSVLSILAVSVFSALIGVDFTAVAETPEVSSNRWGGWHENVEATPFDDGEGTAVNPYIISNGDQLYAMVYNNGKSGDAPAYYKLAKDIYLNDISNYDKWGTDDFDMTSLNNWNQASHLSNTLMFEGTFDGDGHYIYGLYSEGALFAAFLPRTKGTAVIKNVHFRNSYCVNLKDQPEVDRNALSDEEIAKFADKEGYNSKNAVTAGNRTWYDASYGSAAVVVGFMENAAISINNCSVRYAYVKASAFASAMIGASLSSGPYSTVKNCLVADVTLKTTAKEEHAQGVEAAIINVPQGTADSATIEGIISAGVKVYGADDRDALWNGYKVPTASSVYMFKDVYSDVEHKYTVEHYSHGKLSYDDSEIKVVKTNHLKGYKAKEMLDLDWENNWTVVEDDYPMPAKQYNTPTGKDYYAAGGPAAEEDFWDGTTAKNFAAGTGTVEDPYLIENCEQFYLMVSTLKATGNYKIADGVKALYFNNVKGLTYAEVMSVLKSKKMNLYAPGETNEFKGYFDGNGVTIYGIKSEGSNRAGIIPQAGNATLKNFTVKLSKFYASDGLSVESTQSIGAAAVVGDLAPNATLNIRNVDIIDCNVNSVKAAAGLVGCSNINGSVFIDDCIVAGGSIMSDQGSAQHAAFVATSMSGSHTIKNSISYGIHPSADNELSYSSTYKNVYTDMEAPSPKVEENAKGVKLVATDELKGEAVKTTAAEFDWDKTWKTTDGIPELLNHVSTLGSKGEFWSGKIADAYAAGDGSKNNPYQIDTPERLAQMLNYSRAGAYYTLTADIYINDVSAADWTNNAKEWYTSEDVSNFAGIFDGNNCTIYGLYNKDVNSGVYAGLIPVLASNAELRNVKIDNSYLSGNAGAYIGAVAGGIEDNASNIVSIRAASVGENVTIEGAANAGGIVGRVGFTKLRLDNSIFMGKLTAGGTIGGIVGEVIGKIDAKQSVSVGVVPFASADKVVAKTIYTDVACNIDGVITIENSEMIGNNATESMDELPFGSVWSTTAKYPVPTHKVQSFDGVQGQVWSGEIANKFAGGKGTKLSPYLIATPEQLALLINSNTYENKHFKLVADLYLNDVSDELWQAKVGCNSWYNGADFYHAFTSHLDGDGYVVFGMYYNFKTTPQNSYLALIPRIGGNSTVKNIGISEAYIKATTTDSTVYAGGIFGMGSAFYDFYNQKLDFNATVGDEFLVPGESKPRKLPLISNCFVDHTCYIEATSVGGIGCPGGAAVAVRDCIVTANLKGSETSDTREGGIIGAFWTNASRVYNSISFTQSNSRGVGGAQVWARDAGASVIHLENLYYYGDNKVLGTTRVQRPQWRVGEAAKTAMPELDWENTWRTEPDGTPVLRVFDKEGRSASQFSDKQYSIGEVTVNFITGDSSIVLEPMVGKPYEPITFPTVSRQGYLFTGWYAFADCSLLYPYEFFLSRDINVYAGWKKNGINQDFESYTYSSYDCDENRWNYNRPGSRVGYKFEYVHTGTKSMQLLDNAATSADLLINYEERLKVGQDYTMTFWVATDKPNNNVTLTLVQNNHPDYLDTEVSVEPIVTLTNQQAGVWKQYSCNFTAQTQWISIRATGNSSLFVDDVIIAPKGTIVVDANGNSYVISGDFGTTSPKTADTTTVIALISVIICGAVIWVVSKKNSTEVIEKN